MRWHITFELDDPMAVASSEPVGEAISHLFDAVKQAGGRYWAEGRVLSDPRSRVDPDRNERETNDHPVPRGD